MRDLWQTYLSQFVQRYKGSKLERARDLFRQAIESVSAFPMPWPATVSVKGLDQATLNTPVLDPCSRPCCPTPVQTGHGRSECIIVMMHHFMLQPILSPGPNQQTKLGTSTGLREAVRLMSHAGKEQHASTIAHLNSCRQTLCGGPQLSAQRCIVSIVRRSLLPCKLTMPLCTLS